ncbi:hypothetical protein I4U23_014097 [Adineta vaga]|nr:hypothetical protein I4U23_014097 [Adineta vaga]
MRTLSTGILFLAMSISDTIYLLLCSYVLIIYGFKISDQTNYAHTCQFRHFISYLSTNFSAWMLTTITCDRWIRSRYSLRAQQICKPRTAIYSIIVALSFDCLLHIHLLTPMFGQIAPGVTTTCGANRLYSTYSYFYTYFWPSITTFSVTIIPACCIIILLIAIRREITARRNRVLPITQSIVNQQERRRARYLHRQMLILMFATLTLFFFTTIPVGLFRLALSTFNIQQSFSFSLLLASIFGLIITINYALNFYLHCLTSKLFRKEFFKCFPCLNKFTHDQQITNSNHGITTLRQLNRPPQGTVTQLMKQSAQNYRSNLNYTTKM